MNDILNEGLFPKTFNRQARFRFVLGKFMSPERRFPALTAIPLSALPKEIENELREAGGMMEGDASRNEEFLKKFRIQVVAEPVDAVAYPVFRDLPLMFLN